MSIRSAEECYNDHSLYEDDDTCEDCGEWYEDCICDEDEVDDEERWGHDEDNDLMFANPGSNSALRAATKNNPRNLPCPECERPNMLTPEDVRLGYRCDYCADSAERGGY